MAIGFGEWLAAATTTGLMAAAGIMVSRHAIESAREVRRFLAVSVTTTGTVVRLEVSRDLDSIAQHPVVEFAAADGARRSFRSTHGSDPPSHKVGNAVVVRYDPRSPERAEIDSTWSLWGGTLVMAGIGALATFAGVGGTLVLIFRAHELH